MANSQYKTYIGEKTKKFYKQKRTKRIGDFRSYYDVV